MGIFKIYILAILTGFMTGVITIPYRWIIEKSFYVRKMIFNLDNSKYYLILGFLGIYIIGLIINRIVEEMPVITGSGIPQVKGQIYGRVSMVNSLKGIVLKFLGGVMGISSGYSLGREGPSVQMGALIGDEISKVFKVSKVERKYLIMSGASAGLSSAFTAPLASAIFVAEELQKYFNSRLVMFSFLGAITSGYMSSKIFLKNDYLNIKIVYPEGLNYLEYLYICIAFSIFMSFVGKIFSNLLMFFQKKNNEIKISKYIKIFLYTAMIFIIGIFYIDLTAGGESFLIKVALENSTGILMLVFFILLKILFTTLSYSTGFPGGIFLPLLVIGGLSGKLFGLLLVYFNILTIENIGVFIFLGMASVFVVVVRSPATGIILILEMTSDFTLLPSMIVVVGLAYTISNFLKVVPIYDLLYEVLVKNDKAKDEVELVYELGRESYLIDRDILNLELPGKLQLASLERDGNEIEIKDGVKLKQNDIIGVLVPRKNIEEFYDSLRSLAKED
ncbi:ClC family H(+)/Cl(-) exchange transporter [uncultured Cetobacterium sp.]|uniref:ClC family H(+)/Cl(-) exchange transporter n=1 Tax=uncultured Cetobacterium sp. TaxID=527638 RepID=UPI0026202914|nr:ClC family H(+)/Cl(-) exchange transporter [uncultured Cetobacterium sp.]